MDDDSLYSGIDKILKRFNIHRAEYHGGDLTGVHLKQLMENAKDIMDQVTVYLIDSRHEGSEESEDDIKQICENVKTLLILWDGVLSNLHIEFPTADECNETQRFIDAATTLAYRMGMSKTVKGHGAQRHMVSQMRSVHGGLLEFDEQWAERIHQEGYHFDMKYRNLSEYRAAFTRATQFRRTSKPESQEAKKRLTIRFTRGPRKRTLQKRQDAKKVKKERRTNALGQIEL